MASCIAELESKQVTTHMGSVENRARNFRNKVRSGVVFKPFITMFSVGTLGVVYFDQHLGAAHQKLWSKYAFLTAKS